jgi:hypothetical protein
MIHPHKSKQTLFIIHAQARSGTHMLSTALNRHPNISTYGEVLNRYNVTGRQIPEKTPEEATLRWLLSRRRNDPYVGVCIHMNYAMPKKYLYDYGEFLAKNIDSRKNIWEALANWPNLKVITLYRQDHVAQFVSYVRARRTKQWSVGPSLRPGEKEVAPHPFAIDVPHLLRYIKYKVQLEGIALRRFPNAYVVTYEDLCEDFTNQIKRIEQYLGVALKKVNPNTIMVRQMPLWEEVANYNEIAEALANTPYSKYAPLKS